MYGLESFLWGEGKVPFSNFRLWQHRVWARHVDVYSSLWDGWHLLCFTYVCDFWVLPSPRHQHQHGIGKIMKIQTFFSPFTHSWKREQSRIFSICQIAWCWLFWTWSSSKALVYLIFFSQKNISWWAPPHILRVTWKASENYFKVKYHFERCEGRKTKTSSRRFWWESVSVNMCKL